MQKDSCFEIGQVRYVLQSPQKCSCVDTQRNQKKLIDRKQKKAFVIENRKSFCVVISVSLRKARAHEVPLCFRYATSRRTHPHMYHQRSVLSRIHWQVHVKGAVLLSSIHCATMTKISQKILRHTLIWKIHGLVFTTRVEDEFLNAVPWLTDCPHFGQSVDRNFSPSLLYSIFVILTVSIHSLRFG